MVPRGYSSYSRWGMARGLRGVTVAYAMQEPHLILVDAAVPALVAAVIVVGEILSGGASARPAPVALGVCAGLVLVGRRRWPGWTLLACGALVAVLFHVDRSAAAVAVLAPAVALYSVALRRGRLQQLVAGVLAIAAVIAAAAERAARSEARDALERIEVRSHSALGELRGILGVLRGQNPVESPHAPA